MDTRTASTNFLQTNYMITTVKNVKGHFICTSNFVFSLLCTGFIVYFGYFSRLREEWYVLVGLVTSLTATLHQSVLLLKHRTFTRLTGIHAVMVFLYCGALLLCTVLPLTLHFLKYREMSPSILQLYIPLLCIYSANLIPLTVLLISLLYKDRQMIQSYLHPYTEIMDGFAKSNGSIQMTHISTNNLKQVIVDDGKGKGHEVSETDKENIISEADMANGSSPKPSKVLKMWPKADPFPVRALYSFKPTSNSELPFKKGDTITVLDCRGRWWQAQKDDRVGFIPSNYVSVLQKARVISTFTASGDDQVSIKKDEIIEVMEVYNEKSLIRNVEDKIGAVPTDRIELIAAN